MTNLNTYFDKIYYLNLDKDSKRNYNILEQFKRWNITNYKRISGVIVEQDIDFQLYRNYIKRGRKYVLGSYGCALTHLKAIRDAKENGYDRILIFEDDILITINPHELLSNSKHRQDWDIIYFGGLIEPYYRGQIVCAHAYGLSARILDDILNMAIPSGMEIDNFYAKILQHMSYNYTNIGKYVTEIIRPFNKIIQSDEYLSNIKP